MFYVYIIQNNINLKVYVGKTNDPKVRFLDHKKTAERGFTKGRKTFSVIHKAIRKYGIGSFSFQLLEEFDNERDCLDAEKFWIELLRTNVNKFGNEYGYNLTDGGDGISGWHHTSEAKIKIGKSSGERTYVVSADSKRKMSEVPHPLNRDNKIIWPKDQDVLEMVKKSGFTETARKLGVSDNAVRGRLKRRKMI